MTYVNSVQDQQQYCLCNDIKSIPFAVCLHSIASNAAEEKSPPEKRTISLTFDKFLSLCCFWCLYMQVPHSKHEFLFSFFWHQQARQWLISVSFSVVFYANFKQLLCFVNFITMWPLLSFNIVFFCCRCRMFLCTHLKFHAQQRVIMRAFIKNNCYGCQVFCFQSHFEFNKTSTPTHRLYISSHSRTVHR